MAFKMDKSFLHFRAAEQYAAAAESFDPGSPPSEPGSPRELLGPAGQAVEPLFIVESGSSDEPQVVEGPSKGMQQAKPPRGSVGAVAMVSTAAASASASSSVPQPAKRKHRAGKKIAAQKARKAAKQSTGTSAAASSSSAPASSSAPSGRTPPWQIAEEGKEDSDGGHRKGTHGEASGGGQGRDLGRPRKLLPQPVRKVYLAGPSDEALGDHAGNSDFRLRDRESGRILAVHTVPRTYIAPAALLAKDEAQKASRRLVRFLRYEAGEEWVELGKLAEKVGLAAQTILWVVATSEGRRGRRMAIRESPRKAQELEVHAVPRPPKK
jgi:hypothetical protein